MRDVRLVDANSILKKLKSELDGIQRETNYPIGISDGLSFAMATIDTATTIDAQPVKHGHWILHFDDLFPEESTIECSVCHEHSSADMPHDNFCPACGSFNGGK